MNVPGPEDEVPLAWNAIGAETPVHASDGQPVGVVAEVLGSDGEDIFHGIVVRAGSLKGDAEIPATKIPTITNRRVVLDMTAEEVRSLAPYHPEASYQLGFVGLFRKRLGWVPEEKQDGPD